MKLAVGSWPPKMGVQSRAREEHQERSDRIKGGGIRAVRVEADVDAHLQTRAETGGIACG